MDKIPNTMFYLVITFLYLVNWASPLSGNSDSKTGFPLAYEQDFEEAFSFNEFVFSDPEPWFRTGGKEGGWALEFAGKGNYKPKVRSPSIVSLISDYTFGDFVLEADLLQTGRGFLHRDMCIYLGFVDSTSFYYVHLASQAGQASHNIFLVNETQSLQIAHQSTDGVNWIDGYWHHIRIERKTGEGSIKVFFDDMDTPIMIAKDKTFVDGFVGFGSFDDSGKIDNIRVWSPDATASNAKFFSKK